jgi:hypothetical protein
MPGRERGLLCSIFLLHNPHSPDETAILSVVAAVLG